MVNIRVTTHCEGGLYGAHQKEHEVEAAVQ